MTVRRITAITATLVLLLALAPLTAGAAPDEDDDGKIFGDFDIVEHIEYRGGAEVDSDGERYLFAAQAALQENLRRASSVMSGDAEGGLRVIDLHGDEEAGIEPYEVVGFLDCPGTDNYVRYLDPAVYNTEDGDREFVAMAHHGNACTRQDLQGDPRTTSGYSAFNGVAVVDVTDKTDPFIASVVAHYSAHTVMPHPTEPYLYVLPGGLANGSNVPSGRVSPTAIIDLSDPLDPVWVRDFTHNIPGCHDMGFTHDGAYGFCAGLGEVQTWDLSDPENPEVVGTIVNPAIQFPHNVVVSPDGQYIAINDEAFGFHTCTENEAADLYGSLWIYDISVPEVPVLAGRVAPPAHPDPDHLFGTLEDLPGPVYGWAQSWCAAHNYNWVPGTDIIVASWFAGGVTAHDISNPLSPELLFHYMPDDGVMWSGHYYAGHVVTGDMRRGTEILDVPALREAEEAAAAEAADGAAATAAAGLGLSAPLPGGSGGVQALPRVDASSLLIPDVLPPRPAAPRNPWGEGICALPG